MRKLILATAMVLASSAFAQLSELKLSNFFSEGWSDDWAKRVRGSGTPDYALLRVQTNFLEREFRVNGYYQDNLQSKTRRSLTDLDALVAWAFNRRLMLSVAGSFQWDGRRSGTELSGGSSAAAARLQLFDTETSSLSLNLRAAAPNTWLGEVGADLAYGLAGFTDLGGWWSQLGLYYNVQIDSLTAVPEEGDRRHAISYDLSLAKTLTSEKTPVIGNLTVFVENYVQSDLDGGHSGRTSYALTPGARFSPAKENWILLGVDVPVAGYKPWDAVYRLTFIRNI